MVYLETVRTRKVSIRIRTIPAATYNLFTIRTQFNITLALQYQNFLSCILSILIKISPSCTTVECPIILNR